MKNTTPRHHPYALPPRVRVAALVSLGAIVIACTRILLSMLWNEPFEWRDFFTLIAVVVIPASFFFWTAWRHRKQLSGNMHILLIDCGGAVIWYWLFAPTFQSIAMTMNSEQLRVDAFAFFWEVSLLGGMAFAITQYDVRRIMAYVRTGKTADPRRLYRDAELMPLKAIARNVVIAVLGFAIGGWQLRYFSDLPLVEAYKNIGIGMVLPFFLNVYYFITYDNYLGPIRSRIIKQYGLQNMVRSRYSMKVMSVFGILTLGCLLLAILLFLQTIQRYTANGLAASVKWEVDSVRVLNELEHEHALPTIFQGPGSSVAISQPDKPPVGTPVTEETARLLATQHEGQIVDRKTGEKIITFKTVDGFKLYTVVYPTDYYGRFSDLVSVLAWGGVFIIIMTLIVFFFFSRLLRQTLQKLSRAVSSAQATGEYPESHIHTGDEFEALSDAFSHFVTQTRLGSQRLADEHARLQASIASLRLGFIMTDAAGSVLACNEAAHTLIGRQKSAHAHTIQELVAGLTYPLPLLQRWSRCIERQRPVDISHIGYGAKYLDIFITPIVTDNGILGAVIIFHDVTEAQVLSRSKDEFFSIASHELRTPLTVIRGNTSMMLDLYERIMRDEPELKGMVVDMHQASIGLIDIVNDFLDASRLEQGKMTFVCEDIVIDDIARTTVNELSAIAQQKGIYIRTNLDRVGRLPLVHADSKKIKQILYNLIGNSVKFTQNGGIDVQLAADHKYVTIRVTDTGRGIPAKNQKLLFHKFQQAGNNILTRDASHGTGLGLYISRLMLQSMSGRIWLEKSAEGEGSTFCFTVPIAKQQQPAKPTP